MSESPAAPLSPLVSDARNQLQPLLEAVLETVQGPLEQSFFAQLLVQLTQAREDLHLLEFFMQLSTTAFQGFAFTDADNLKIDLLLARAEDIAHALSADEADGFH